MILTMTVVILAYDQFLFRPLVAWADKFRMEKTSSGDARNLAARPDAPHPPDPRCRSLGAAGTAIAARLPSSAPRIS